MSRQTSQNQNGIFNPDQTSPSDFSAPGAGLDAFAGLSEAAQAAAMPLATSASPGIPPLDLAALGEQTSQSGVGTIVVAAAKALDGNIAYVNTTMTAAGTYTVSAGIVDGRTGANGGATAALASSNSGGRLGDASSFPLNFRPTGSNMSAYSGSQIRIGSSNSAFTRLALGSVSVLGWNSNSILLSITASQGAGTTSKDVVISTEDMSKQAHSLPTDTTFTTTGPAPTVLGVTVPEVPCFAAGTLIATPEGPRMVETLAEGCEVLTFGGATARISWVGSRVVKCSAHPAPDKILPVRIRRHAFGVNLPQRDLVLSPDHAVFLRGVLIPICELINGQNVVQERVHTVRYVHVELPLHDILLAEGLPCESFLDIGNHRQFGEGPGPIGLHADFAATALAWEAACAPLCLHGPEIDAARALLAGQSALAA